MQKQLNIMTSRGVMKTCRKSYIVKTQKTKKALHSGLIELLGSCYKAKAIQALLLLLQVGLGVATVGLGPGEASDQSAATPLCSGGFVRC